MNMQEPIETEVSSVIHKFNHVLAWNPFFLSTTSKIYIHDSRKKIRNNQMGIWINFSFWMQLLLSECSQVFKLSQDQNQDETIFKILSASLCFKCKIFSCIWALISKYICAGVTRVFWYMLSLDIYGFLETRIEWV